MSENVFNKEPEIPLEKAKYEIMSIILIEKDRHESAIEVALHQYEIALRSENSSHKRRIHELETVLSMITEHMKE